MQIHIVKTYDDRADEWTNVAAFDDEDVANEFAAQLQEDEGKVADVEDINFNPEYPA